MPRKDTFKEAVRNLYNLVVQNYSTIFENKGVFDTTRTYDTNYMRQMERKMEAFTGQVENIKTTFAYISEDILNAFGQLDTYTNEAGDKFLTSVAGLKDSLTEFLGNEFFNAPTQDQNILNSRKSVKEAIENLQKISESNEVKQLENFAHKRENFIDSCSLGTINEKIKNEYAKNGFNGTSMTIEDCRNFSPVTDDIDKTTSQLLWLINQEYKNNRIYGNGNTNNYYMQSLNRFSDEMEVAPLDVQEQFAEKLLLHELGLRDKCFEQFNSFKTNAPKNMDAEVYAYTKLNELPEYASLCAINNFKGNMRDTRLVGIISNFALADQDILKDRSIAQRPSTIMQDISNGGMSRFFDKNNIKKNDHSIEAHEFINYTRELQQGGLVMSKDLNNVAKEFEKLAADTGKASQSMTDMRDTVKAFLSINQGDPLNTPNYETKLNAALDAVNAYVSSHSGHRFTDSGKERARIAKALSESLTNVKKEYENKRDLVFDLGDFLTLPATEDKAMLHAANSARRAGFNAKQFAEKISKVQPKATEDYQKFYDQIRAHINTEDTPQSLHMPELDLKVDQATKTNKDRIHDIALKNLAESKFLLDQKDVFLDQAVKLREIDEDKASPLRDRTTMAFLFDYGDDPETNFKNIQIAKKFTGVGISGNDAQDQIQKAQAEVVKSRIEKFQKVDFNKYLNLSDEELAKNCVNLCKECFAFSEIQSAVDKFSLHNKYITDDVKKNAAALVNKYSTVMPYLYGRVNLMASSYYSSVDTDKLLNVKDSILGNMGTDAPQINTKVDKFTNAASNAVYFRSLTYSNLMQNEIVKDPSDLSQYTKTEFFDKDGNEIATTQVFEKNKEGVVFAMSKGDPSTLTAFSYNGFDLSFDKEDPTRYKDVYNSILQRPSVAEFKKDAYANALIKETVKDEKEFGKVTFFDKDGKELKKSAVYDASLQGPVFTIHDGKPETIKAFKAGEKPFEFKAESLNGKEAVCERIAALTDKAAAQRYKDYAAELTKDPYKPFDLDNTLGSALGRVRALNFMAKATELGLEYEENTDLKMMHNAIYNGMSLEDVMKMPGADEIKDKIPELYKAGRVDFHNKGNIEKTVDNVLAKFKITEINKDSLKAAANGAQIPLADDNVKNAAKQLQKDSFAAIKKSIKARALGYGMPNRALGMVVRKPGLDDKQKFELSQQASTSKGQKLIVQDMMDDLLTSDFDEFNKVTPQQFAKDYDNLDYKRLMLFDTSYMSLKAFKDMYSPNEAAKLFKLSETMASPLNQQLGLLEANLTDAPSVIDLKTLDMTKCVAVMGKDKANGNFWNAMTSIAYNSISDVQLNKAKELQSDLIESRWVNTLLGNPDITKEELEFVDKCVNMPDKAAGRNLLYEYAQNVFTKAADGIEEAKTNPEKASFVRACGSAGKLLMKQMKDDGYDFDQASFDKLKENVDKMVKVDGDISTTIKRGRQLNKPTIIEALKEKSKSYVKGMTESMKNKDAEALLDNVSNYLYTNKILEKAGKLSPKELAGYCSLEATKSGVKNLEKPVADFIKRIETPNLKTMIEENTIDAQLLKGFDFFVKNEFKPEVVQNNNPQVEQKAPEKNEPMIGNAK